MSSFLTQCPHCLTSFRVTDVQLDAAEGLVRCGACLGVFSAAANRITLKQTPEDGVAPEEFDELEDEDLESVNDEDDGDDEDEDHDDDDDAYEDDAPASSLTEELVISPDVIPGSYSSPHPAIEHADPEIAASSSATMEVRADADLLDAEDFDIPLGDFNLDDDERSETHDDDGMFDEADDGALDDETEFDDDEAYDDEEYEDDEEEDDDHDDEEDDDQDDEEDVDDDDDDDETEALYEEYTDEAPSGDVTAQGDDEDPLPEEFEPEIHFEDDDEEFIDAADEALSTADYEDVVETPPVPAPQRPPGARINAEKTELRRYLAAIEDDDALGTIDDDAALDAIDEPVMLDSAPRRGRLAGFALFAANVLLAGVLLLQVADANIDALNRNARFAFAMPFVCRVLECPLPERSQLDLLVSEQLLVRSHPRFAQALEVNLVFRNDATVAQPFPALELGFHDTGNRPLANRLFAPSEYLPPELRTSEMPAQSSLQITLELADPGSEAVNYTLAFRKPQ